MFSVPDEGPVADPGGTTGGQAPSQSGPGPAFEAFVLSLGHIHVLLPCFLWNTLHLTVCFPERRLPAPPTQD